MSAFTVASVVGFKNDAGALKEAVITVTGTASYDTNGSVINLGTGGVLGASQGFQSVHGVEVIKVSAHASDRYKISYVNVSAAAGTLKVRDAAAMTAMSEVANTTDLSSITWTLRVVGT